MVDLNKIPFVFPDKTPPIATNQLQRGAIQKTNFHPALRKDSRHRGNNKMM